MFETVMNLFNIIFAVKKSKMINFFLITILLINDVCNVESGLSEPGQFNYVVSIQLLDEHFCTGTIIDETRVLTIAHVFIGRYKHQLSIAAGVTMVLHPSVHTFPVGGIYFHPELRKIDMPGAEDYWENDIAILKLAKRFEWSINYGPVQFMVEAINWLLCPDCMMIHWVNPEQDNKDLLVQMWQFVEVRRDELCHNRNITVLENQKCFSNLMDTLLITSEDLGSPIICNNSMVGFVTKKTDNEIKGTPSTFLQTFTYSGFIHEVLTEGLIDVGPAEYPYIVSIWHTNNYICGGSILDATHILTAAHCVWGLEQAQLKVVAGYTQVSRQDVAVEGLLVDNIIFHTLYRTHFFNYKNYSYTQHDIAVVVLAKPVMFALTFLTFDYESITDFSPGQFCESFHWRYERNRSGMKAIKLRKARMRISCNEFCERILESQEMTLTAFQFCAKNPYNIRIADYRDCGTPIISEGKPVGILVRAFPLGDESPSVAIFLWLQPYKDFIRFAISKS